MEYNLKDIYSNYYIVQRTAVEYDMYINLMIDLRIRILTITAYDISWMLWKGAVEEWVLSIGNTYCLLLLVALS